MSYICAERVKDHGDGEVHIKITCDFTYFEEKDTLLKIREAFEETMSRFSI